MIVQKGGISRNIDPKNFSHYKEKGYAVVGGKPGGENSPGDPAAAKPVDFSKGWNKAALQAYLKERNVPFDEASTNAALAKLCEQARDAEAEQKENAE